MEPADVAPVAMSGNYNDLQNLPVIPPAQTNSDWTASSGVSVILNKPTLFSGAYVDLTGKPTIPAAQVNSDWTSVSGLSMILNKPTIPTVPKVLYFTGTTNASGVWTIPISGFTTVTWISAMALNSASTAAGVRWATVTTYNTTSATGTVAVGNTIVSLLGLLGITLVGAGVTVQIRVEGT